MTPAKADLKPYPYHDGAVNENAAQRVVRLAMPLCPIDGNPELKQRDGTYKPNPNFTGEINCQLATQDKAGRWDVQGCIDKGHDPYHFKLRRAVVEEAVDENGYVTDTKIRYIVENRLNVMPISISRRVGSGQMANLAIARGGKPLEEFGYASPCEFRSCSQPQKVDTRFGKYCSERHARLVAQATRPSRKNFIIIPTDPLNSEADIQENEDTLNSFNISKVG